MICGQDHPRYERAHLRDVMGWKRIQEAARHLILECAIDSSSDHLITYDKHLLVLEEFQEIKILKPEQFLEIIRTL